jgi:hypothetical protein
MTEKKKVDVHRTVYTFAYLRNISYTCLKKAKAEEKGSSNLIASSMVFSAFSFEAYLNHLGSHVTDFWNIIERKLSPKEKLETLGSILKMNIDYGSRPFQTFNRMIALRNTLAHGKTEILTENSIQILADGDVPRVPSTSWEEEISIDNASRYLDDSKEMIQILNSKAGIEDFYLFVPEEANWFMSNAEDDT